MQSAEFGTPSGNLHLSEQNQQHRHQRTPGAVLSNVAKLALLGKKNTQKDKYVNFLEKFFTNW